MVTARKEKSVSTRQKKPRHIFTGKLFWVGEQDIKKEHAEKLNVKNPTKLSIGMNFDEIPNSIKKAYGKGKEGHEEMMEAMSKKKRTDKEGKEHINRTLFAGYPIERVKGEAQIGPGDSVEVETSVNIAKDGKVYFNLHSIDVLVADDDFNKGASSDEGDSSSDDLPEGKAWD